MNDDSTIRPASAPDSPDETPSTVPEPKRQHARLALIGVVLVGCGAWAFWPLSSPSDGTSLIATDSTPAAPPNPQREPLDMAAFRTPLWMIPAPPPPPPAPLPPAPAAPPPPPLNWQLIAITQEQSNDRPELGIEHGPLPPGLLPVLEDDLPVPVDEVFAVGTPVDGSSRGGTSVGCRAERQACFVAVIYDPGQDLLIALDAASVADGDFRRIHGCSTSRFAAPPVARTHAVLGGAEQSSLDADRRRSSSAPAHGRC